MGASTKRRKGFIFLIPWDDAVCLKLAGRPASHVAVDLEAIDRVGVEDEGRADNMLLCCVGLLGGAGDGGKLWLSW